MNIFGLIMKLWIFFWGHQETGLLLGVIFVYFRAFSQGQGTHLLNFKYFWGMPNIPDIFGG